MTRKILTYSPHCAEALYEDILSQFRKGKGAIAAHQLIKLVKKSREYYIHALIDPELSKFRDLIHPRVKALLEEARDEAEKTILEAREELEDLRRWLGRDETETQEAETLFSKMEELSKVDGYFSHLDVIYYMNLLIPGLGISHQNIWSYQKTMLTLGAFSALLMALVTSGGSPSHKGTP